MNWLAELALKCEKDWYIFGKKLLPGPERHIRNWISRLWNEIVKQGMGIDVSLYSFKGRGGDDKRDAGISIPGVMAGFGHTKESTSLIYLKKEGHRRRQEINLIEIYIVPNLIIS